MKQSSKYDPYTRQQLIMALHERDREIQKLRSRTLDDFIREQIDDQISAASWAIRNGNR